jgi:hypothetical protein
LVKIAFQTQYVLDENLLSDRSLFCQLDQLCHFDDGTSGWKETARYNIFLITAFLIKLTLKCRWLKYEEKVDSANRWSKPHVSTTSLHSLVTLRQMISEGDIITLFDVDVKSMKDLAGCTGILNEAKNLL